MAALKPVFRHAGPWPISWALYVSCLLTLLIFFWDTAFNAIHTWSQSVSYSHCFLVIPISAFLIWRRRFAVRSLEPRPTFLGIAVLLFMVLLWKIGEVSGTLVIQEFAFIGMAQALFMAIMGLRLSYALAFPLIYLYFAVPFGGFLIAPLQEVTAVTAVRLLHLSGIPVHLDGFLIEIPGGSFHIAEACAGVRFLVTSLAIGVLAAHLLFSSWLRRLLFVFAAILIPVLSNGLRAYGIILIAHLESLTFARAVDHVTFGLIFLSFVLAVLLGMGWAMREKNYAGVSEDRRSVTSNLVNTVDLGRFSAKKVLTVGAAAVVVLIGIHFAEVERDSGYAKITASSLPPPTVDTPWVLLHGQAVIWRPRIAESELEVLVRYTNGKRTVDFFAAYFGDQRQGAEVVNQLNDLSGGRTWELVPAGVLKLSESGAIRSMRLGRLVSRHGERLLLYCYWVDGTCTPDALVAKLRQAKVGLLGGSPAALLIAASTPVDNSAMDGVETLREFFKNLEPLNRWLERSSSRSGDHTSASRPKKTS